MDDITESDDTTPYSGGASAQDSFANYLSGLIWTYFSSKAAFARAAYVVPGTVTNWRKGKTCPSKGQADRLVELFKRRIDKPLRQPAVQFEQEKFMELWLAAHKVRSQPTKPPAQPPQSDLSDDPNSVQTSDTPTLTASRPNRGRPDPLSNADLQADDTQDFGPPASDSSAPARRRAMVLLGLALIIVVIVVSLVYIAVPWRSNRQATPPDTPTIANHVALYSVSSDSSTGGHVHQLPQGGSVDQQFLARTPMIIQLAAIIGREGYPDRSVIGKVKFQLLDCTATPVEYTAEALNNIDTNWTPNQPIPVIQGQMCTLRVINLTPVFLGFYFNNNPNPVNRTVLHEAIDPPGASTPHEHALSGHVFGRS